jgi:hypothetical protein
LGLIYITLQFDYFNAIGCVEISLGSWSDYKFEVQQLNSSFYAFHGDCSATSAEHSGSERRLTNGLKHDNFRKNSQQLPLSYHLNPIIFYFNFPAEYVKQEPIRATPDSASSDIKYCILRGMSSWRPRKLIARVSTYRKSATSALNILMPRRVIFLWCKIKKSSRFFCLRNCVYIKFKSDD